MIKIINLRSQSQINKNKSINKQKRKKILKKKNNVIDTYTFISFEGDLPSTFKEPNRPEKGN